MQKLQDSTLAVDIVVPVWNSPQDARRCINSLAEHSPQARLILVDNGSERETERLLEEFAEILDHRALLLKSDANLGFVRALNHGLTRAEAPYLAVVKTGSLVDAGWLEPLLAESNAHPDAGMLVPTLVPYGLPKAKAARSADRQAVEADHGSFSAMLVRKELFGLVGTLDEGMDSALWCLRDYSRRAWRAGFRTISVPTAPVTYKEENVLGSALRRRERVEQSMLSYRTRWGVAGAYFLHVPKSVAASEVPDRLEILLEGSRQGSRFIVTLSKTLAREMAHSVLHRNITLCTYPPVFAAEWVNRLFKRTVDADPELQPVRWGDDDAFPADVQSIAFSQLQERVAQARYGYYSLRT